MVIGSIIKPGPAPDTLPRPNEAEKPRNIVLNWKKGTQLADALKQTLQTGYPGVTVNVNISPQLVAPQDNIGYYPTLKELGEYLRPVSHQIMTGQAGYPGVGLCLQQGEIDVHDGTSPPGSKDIQLSPLFISVILATSDLSENLH